MGLKVGGVEVSWDGECELLRSDGVEDVRF